MDKFHVGQKVRIVRPKIPVLPLLPGEERYIGMIATVTSPGFFDWGGNKRYHLDFPPEASGIEIVPIEEALAPVYDGDTPIAWEDCAWRPEKITIPKNKETEYDSA